MWNATVTFPVVHALLSLASQPTSFPPCGSGLAREINPTLINNNIVNHLWKCI